MSEKWWEEDAPVSADGAAQALLPDPKDNKKPQADEKANWWEEDNAIRDDVGPKPLLSIIENEKKRLEDQAKLHEAHQSLEKYGEIPHVANQIVTDTATLAERLVGNGDRADEVNREQDIVSQAMTERDRAYWRADEDPEGMSTLEQAGQYIPFLKQGVRGAVRSLGSALLGAKGAGAITGAGKIAAGGLRGAAIGAAEAGAAGVAAGAAQGAGVAARGALGAAGGSAYGAIGLASSQEANRAITEGADAGLEGSALAAYVGSQGIIEALPATVMQRVGLGGVEAMIAGPSIRSGIKAGILETVKRTGQEIPEELMTEIGHAVASEYSKVDPQALSNDSLSSLVADVVLQTVLMGAGAGAMQGAKGQLERLQEMRAKGFVSEEDAKKAGIEGKSRKERLANADKKIEELKQVLAAPPAAGQTPPALPSTPPPLPKGPPTATPPSVEQTPPPLPSVPPALPSSAKGTSQGRKPPLPEVPVKPGGEAGAAVAGAGQMGKEPTAQEVPVEGKPSSSKEPWQMLPDEYATGDADQRAIKLSAHPNHVKKALEEGKSVPVEVLESYKNNKWAKDALAQSPTTPQAPAEPTQVTPKPVVAPEAKVEPAKPQASQETQPANSETTPQQAEATAAPNKPVKTDWKLSDRVLLPEGSAGDPKAPKSVGTIIAGSASSDSVTIALDGGGQRRVKKTELQLPDAKFEAGEKVRIPWARGADNAPATIVKVLPDGKYEVTFASGRGATQSGDQMIKLEPSVGPSEGSAGSPTVIPDAPVTPETRKGKAEGEDQSSEASADKSSARKMEPTEEGRPADGKPVMPGDRFLTNTGRETTPYPKYDGSTERKTQNGEKRSQQWLIENAMAEAESRGDDFNLTTFRSQLEDARKGKLPQASKDSATLYVFGEDVPKVPKPLLKDRSQQPPSIVPDGITDESSESSAAEIDRRMGKQPESKWQSETRAKLESVPALKGAKVETDEKAGTAKVTRPDGLTTTIHFNADEELAKAATEKGRKPESVHGRYVRKPGEKTGSIYLHSSANHSNVLNREVMHWLEDSGVVTPAEVEKYGGREEIAEKYGKWASLKHRSESSDIGKMFKRIRDFLEPLLSAQSRFFEDVSKRSVASDTQKPQPQKPDLSTIVDKTDTNKPRKTLRERAVEDLRRTGKKKPTEAEAGEAATEEEGTAAPEATSGQTSTKEPTLFQPPEKGARRAIQARAKELGIQKIGRKSEVLLREIHEAEQAAPEPQEAPVAPDKTKATAEPKTKPSSATEQARENLRKRGKRKPSQAELDAETAAVIRERESDNKVRQEFQADRDAQKAQDARREFVGKQKLLANPATVDSLGFGDIAQVNYDIERGRVSYEDAVKVADEFVAAGYLSQLLRDRIQPVKATAEPKTKPSEAVGVETKTPDRIQQIQDTFQVKREVAIVGDILSDAMLLPGEVEIALPGTPIPNTDALLQKAQIPLYQKQRNKQGTIQAWTHFVNASKAIIGATSEADVSSFFHEIFHPAHEFLFNDKVPQEERGNITDEDINEIEKWLGVDPNRDRSDGGTSWTREQKEKFVDGGMKFLREGIAPTPELQTVFQKIAEWLADVISLIARDVDISNVRHIYVKMFERGQISPEKLQALKEALASESETSTEADVEDSEADFGDLFAEVFGETATVEESSNDRETPGQPVDSGPEEGEKRPAEDKEATGRIKGRPTKVGKRKAHYEVVELSELTASHHPFGLQVDDQFPADWQKHQRRYEKLPPGQKMEVALPEGGFDPDVVLDPTRGHERGPTMVVEHEGKLFVVGGTRRFMMLANQYDRAADKGQPYHDALVGEAEEFDLDAEAVGGMIQPILIRVIDEPGNVPLLIDELNVDVPFSKDVATEAASLGRGVGRNTVAVLRTMGDEETLNKFLDRKGMAVLEGMVKDNPELRSKMPGWVRGDSLTKDAKLAVQNAIMGAVIPDATLLSQASPKLLQSVNGALSEIVALNQKGGEWSLSGRLEEAITYDAEFRSTGEPANSRKIRNWMKSNQQSFLEGFAKDETSDGYRLWQYLLSHGGARKFRAAVQRTMIREARLDSTKGGLFAETEESMSGNEAFELLLSEGDTGQDGSDAGQDTSDTLFQRTQQTDTPEFRKWFGDSKVVNEDGEPLVVYHGTAGKTFSEFDENKIRPGLFFGKGFYFTSNAELASSYAERREGGRVIPVFLRAVNLFVYDRADMDSTTRMMDSIGAKISTVTTLPDNPEKFLEKVKVSGYDGIVVHLSSKPTTRQGEYIVFDPTQIKSATGNRGTFDPTNPNILLQASVDPKRQAAQLAKDALESGATTFGDYVDYAVQAIGTEKVKASASVLEGFWNYLRTRQGYKHLGPAGKVSDINPEEVNPKVAKTSKTETPKQPTSPDGPTTGTKHAKTDELRAEHGFPERIPPTPETFQEWEDQARRQYPDAAARLRVIDAAEKNPKGVGKIENAVIGQHIVDLENRRNAGEDVRDELLRTIKVANVVGSEAGRALVSRKAERYGDFSLAALINDHFDAVGKDPTNKQIQEYSELADRIKQLETEKLDLAKNLAEEAIARKKAESAANKKPKPPQDKIGTKREQLKKQASAAVAAFKAEWATLSQLGAVSDPRQQADKWVKITNAAGKVIKAYVELGVDSFLGLMASVKRDMGDLEKYQVDAFKEAWETHQKVAKVKSPLGEDPEQAAIGARAKELMVAAIEAGYGSTKETWMEVVDAVHSQLSIEVPGISEYDTMQAMSDYGVWRPLNKEEVATKIRAIRGKARQSLKIEDTVKAIDQSKLWIDSGVSPEEVASRLQEQGLLPKATGREQATPDSIERALIAEFNKLKKTLPVSVESTEGQLKSALSTAKTAGRNRLEALDRDIEALEEAIAKLKELVKPVDDRTPLKTDPELVAIREQLETKRKQRAELKAKYETIFPPTKKQRMLTAEQQTDRALKAIEKLKEKLQQIKDGKDTDTKKKPSLVAAEVRALGRMWQERLRAAKQAAKEAELARYEGEGGALLPPAGRKTLTDEQRVAMSERMLQQQIDAVKADTRALEAGTWVPATKGAVPTSEAKAALKAELAALKEIQEQAKKASPAYQAREEAKDWERYRKSQERRLAFWENRRDEAESGILPVPRKKRTITENAIIDKNLEIEKVQYEAMHAIEKANRATWNKGQWIGHGLLEATSLIPKSLQLGLELSFFKRQGFFYARSHFIKAFMAAVEAIPAVFSQRLALASMEDIESRPNARDYHLAGVDFTQVQGPKAKLEEMFQSSVIQWLENTEGKLFLPLRTWAKLYAAFERGNRTFSNIMKADLYDIQKRDTLAAREFFGDSTTWTENDIKQAGRTSNIFSGRGTGLKGGNPWLDFVFLARRWAWSRIQADFVVPFQLMTPKTIGQWNADRGMRVALAKLYIQTLMGHATKLAIGYWVYSLLAGDDEEKKPTIEFDPRSSDVGALKMGETRLKDEGGLMPAIVLAARVATGTMKTSKGEIKSIYGEDVQWGGKTAADFIINYGRYKLGTGPSAILEWASGKDAVGNPVTKAGIITSRLTPLTHREIVAAEKELGVVQGTMVALEAVFGVSVSTYGPRTTYRNSNESERAEQVEKDLENLEWDSPTPAYAEFLTQDQLTEFEERKHYRYGLKVNQAVGDPESEAGIKTRDKAIDVLKSSGYTYDEIKKSLIDYLETPDTYGENKGKKRSVRVNGVLNKDTQKKLGMIRKILAE